MKRSEWCDLWGMKLRLRYDSLQVTHNASKSPALTIAGTVLKESDNHVIFGVTFDSKMTFEKHLRSVCRAASQLLGILRGPGKYSLLDYFLGDALLVLSCPFWNTAL